MAGRTGLLHQGQDVAVELAGEDSARIVVIHAFAGDFRGAGESKSGRSEREWQPPEMTN
jgi:hypothetical protein